MRLVLRYQDTDGYTYFCTCTVPVEYDSAEALLVDLMEGAESALLAGREFVLLGHSFDPTLFFSRLEDDQCRAGLGVKVLKVGNAHWLPVPPEVLTLDEWFNSADALKA